MSRLTQTYETTYCDICQQRWGEWNHNHWRKIPPRATHESNVASHVCGRCWMDAREYRHSEASEETPLWEQDPERESEEEPQPFNPDDPLTGTRRLQV